MRADLNRMKQFRHNGVINEMASLEIVIEVVVPSMIGIVSDLGLLDDICCIEFFERNAM